MPASCPFGREPHPFTRWKCLRVVLLRHFTLWLPFLFPLSFTMTHSRSPLSRFQRRAQTRPAQDLCSFLAASPGSKQGGQSRCPRGWSEVGQGGGGTPGVAPCLRPGSPPVTLRAPSTPRGENQAPSLRGCLPVGPQQDQAT